MDQKYIPFIDLDDNEKLLRIIIEFNLEQFGKDYVVATPDEVNENEDIEFFVFSVTSDADGVEYQPLETEEEWAACEEVIDALLGEEELQSDMLN